MNHIIELIGGKYLVVTEQEALAVDRAWGARQDIEVQGVKVPANQIAGVWPQDIWIAAENEKRTAKGQEPIPVKQNAYDNSVSAFGLLLSGQVTEEPKELSAIGKLWFEAMRLNVKQLKTKKYGQWVVENGKLVERPHKARVDPPPVTANKERKTYSPHQFNKLKESPGYKVVGEDTLEYTHAS